MAKQGTSLMQAGRTPCGQPRLGALPRHLYAIYIRLGRL
jgi:hypothetical protein